MGHTNGRCMLSIKINYRAISQSGFSFLVAMHGSYNCCLSLPAFGVNRLFDFNRDNVTEHRLDCSLLEKPITRKKGR